MTLSVIPCLDSNLVSRVFHIATPHCIFLSLMSSWVIIWNRTNDFCLWETQVTILTELSKQSRKKGSFHSISEVVVFSMTFECYGKDEGQRNILRDRMILSYPVSEYTPMYHEGCPGHTHEQDRVSVSPVARSTIRVCHTTRGVCSL